MSKSYTYHVIGYATISNTQQAVYPCMNKVEMVQSIIKAKKENLTITEWTAQTKVGYRMLGSKDFALTKEIKLPKLADCPICNTNGCIVCNYSGMTQNNYWKKWQPWQLKNIHAKAAGNEESPLRDDEFISWNDDPGYY